MNSKDPIIDTKHTNDQVFGMTDKQIQIKVHVRPNLTKLKYWVLRCKQIWLYTIFHNRDPKSAPMYL